MNRLKLLTCLILIAFALSACATAAERAAFHQAQVDAITMQMAAITRIKPLLHIEAQPGQTIVMSGVKSLEVYYPITGEAFKQVEQFKDEYVPVYLAAMNLMGIPISIATQGYFFNEALKTTMGGAGNTYYGANNTGTQAGQIGAGSTFQSPFGSSSNANGNASSGSTNAPVSTVGGDFNGSEP